MKKLVLMLAFIATAIGANAQKNVVKVNPFGLLFGTIPLQYERVLGAKSAVGVDVSFMNYSASLGSESASFTGFGFEGKYKISISSKRDMPRGWYVAPLAGYSTASAKTSTSSGGFNIINFGAVSGYQWVFGKSDKGFALDINLGANYMNLSTNGSAQGVSLKGILPRLGLGIGYAF
jgi:hypothetical protein